MANHPNRGPRKQRRDAPKAFLTALQNAHPAIRPTLSIQGNNVILKFYPWPERPVADDIATVMATIRDKNSPAHRTLKALFATLPNGLLGELIVCEEMPVGPNPPITGLPPGITHRQIVGDDQPDEMLVQMFAAYQKLGGQKDLDAYDKVLAIFMRTTNAAYIFGDGDRAEAWQNFVEQAKVDRAEAERIFNSVDSVAAYS